MVVASIDWNAVLVAFIPTVPALVAAFLAGRTHAHIQTPSGEKLGHVAEYAKDTATANNMLLSKANGATKPADPVVLKHEAETPPQVPSDPPLDAE